MKPLKKIDHQRAPPTAKPTTDTDCCYPLPLTFHHNFSPQDIDKQQCGSLPRVSLDRALGQRGLLPLLSARERELVYKCFGYRKGCGDEVGVNTTNH